jgi:acetyl-CoA carboxylase beta subunit
MASQRDEQFAEVCSQDFLRFQFGGRSYQDQLNDSIAKTEVLAGVKVERISVPVDIAGKTVLQELVWVTHNFGFLGGSLGCAEGEKITRAFELAAQEGLPVCVQCRTGGARMQEGTSSLMQMAKVSVAVQALGQRGLPFISVLNDPTFGGVSASYAMQADVRIAVALPEKKEGDGEQSFAQPRIGFAGPAVILNTMCEGSQSRFDEQCPNDFQSAELVRDCGQIDTVLRAAGGQADVERSVAAIAHLLCTNRAQAGGTHGTGAPEDAAVKASIHATLQAACQGAGMEVERGEEAGAGEAIDYTRSRRIDRPQTQDFLQALLCAFTELSGDGKVGSAAFATAYSVQHTAYSIQHTAYSI